MKIRRCVLYDVVKINILPINPEKRLKVLGILHFGFTSINTFFAVLINI